MVTFAIGAVGYALGLPTGLPIAALVLCVLYAATRFTTRGFGVLALVVSLRSLSVWAVPTILQQVRSGLPEPSPISRRCPQPPRPSPASGLIVLTWAAADQVRAATDRAALAEASQHAQAQERVARAEVGALKSASASRARCMTSLRTASRS